MYRNINDFLGDWAYETEATLKVFHAIKEDRKAEKLHQNIRSLERLAWHLTQTLPEMTHRAGLLDKDALEQEPIPSSFESIISEYQRQSGVIADAVKQKWTDDTLLEEVNMYGQNWKKGQVLSILIRHQAHHRGQMTTIMRWLNMQVPGVYGPSREEWSQMGVPAME